MKTGLHQQTGLRQELRINPRLYQAMDMLYMPMLDLQQHLQQELLNNPFLELEEPEEEQPAKTAEEEQAEVKKDDEVDWEEILLHGFEVGGSREQFEPLQYIEPVSVETRGLSDYLREQLQMLEVPPRLHLLCEEIIGNINEDGYLACTAEEVLAAANQWLVANNPARRRPDEDSEDPFRLEEEDAIDETLGDGKLAEAAAGLSVPQFTPAEFEAALNVIQSLDPPGIGARDLRECLVLQMRDAGDTESLAYRLVDQVFPDLIAHRWNDIARKFGVEPHAAQQAADALARFDPKPGLKHSDHGDTYIVPDLIVEKIGNAVPGLPQRHRRAAARACRAPTRRSPATGPR